MVKQTQTWLNKTYCGSAGYTPFSENELDGITGQGTFKRLIQGLQIELNKIYGCSLTVDGSFGNATINALPPTIAIGYSYKNIVKIIQGSFWCKGYSAGPIDGIYGVSVENAVKQFENDAGLTSTGVITPIILQGIMNTDAYFYAGDSGTLPYYQHLVQKAMNQKYGSFFGLVAPNGIWERKSHKMLIKCCQKVWNITSPDGIWGNNTQSKAPTLSINNGSSNQTSIILLQWALTINGYYTGTFSGIFDVNLKDSVFRFQEFMCIGADGIASKGTWASLLSSKGDTNRNVKALDTATRLTTSVLNLLKSQGYTDIGRYLTNATTGLDKKLTLEELADISNAGFNTFFIYQTSGNNEGYFSLNGQGLRDASLAKIAAQKLYIPYGTTIYFAVDFDVKTAFIEQYIVPYFRELKLSISGLYQIGVYGPRAVCNALAKKGLTRYSFVADMSSGFTGNIGQPMPINWAYEQISEVTTGGIGIDKCVVSPRGTGIIWKLPTPLPNIDTFNPVNEELVEKYINDLNVYDETNHCFYPNSNPAVVYATLKNAGLNIYAIAGFLGNIQTEGFNTALSGHDGSVGICQWRDIPNPQPGSNEGLRRTNFFSFADDCNVEDKESIQFQANFILEECNSDSPYKSALAVKCFKKLNDEELTSSTIVASDYVTAFYEGCFLCKTLESIHSCGYSLDRFDLDNPNIATGYYYLDTPKRRGYTEVYYKYILDMYTHHTE